MTPTQRKAMHTRRGAQAAFALGAAFSFYANILASVPTVTGIIFGTWPAVALLLSVYMFEHAPRTWWIKSALGAMIAVAAWTSYWHIVHVAMDNGVDPVSAHLMPITVDVMMGLAQLVLNKKPVSPAKPSPRRKAAATPATRKLKAV